MPLDKMQKVKRKKKSYLKIILYTLFLLFLFLVGTLVGMLMGTYAVIDHVAYGLAGSTLIVNINETKLADHAMEEFNKTILPQLQPPYDINYDATCPGLNKSKTVAECIKELEDKS